MKTKIKIVIVKYEVLSTASGSPNPADGDIDKVNFMVLYYKLCNRPVSPINPDRSGPIRSDSRVWNTDFVIQTLYYSNEHSNPEDLLTVSFSHYVDQYLDNFCAWQARKYRVRGQENWDHAIMLTGLNLYVIHAMQRIH